MLRVLLALAIPATAVADSRVAVVAPVQEEPEKPHEPQAPPKPASTVGATSSSGSIDPNITVAYYRLVRGPLFGDSSETLQYADHGWGGGVEVVVGLRENPTIGLHIAGGTVHVHAVDANAPEGRYDGYRIVPAGIAVGFPLRLGGVPLTAGGVVDLIQLEYLDGAPTLPYATQGTFAIGGALRGGIDVALAFGWMRAHGVWVTLGASVGLETQYLSVQSSGVRTYESDWPPVGIAAGFNIGIKVGDRIK